MNKSESRDSKRKTKEELLTFYIMQRRNMDSTSAFSIGHATVITALRKSTPQEALACLEEKQQLNASALILYKGERFYWEMAPMMRKLLSARVRLYAKVIGQIKETAEFQETASPPASC